MRCANVVQHQDYGALPSKIKCSEFGLSLISLTDETKDLAFSRNLHVGSIYVMDFLIQSYYE